MLSEATCLNVFVTGLLYYFCSIFTVILFVVFIVDYLKLNAMRVIFLRQGFSLLMFLLTIAHKYKPIKRIEKYPIKYNLLMLVRFGC